MAINIENNQQIIDYLLKKGANPNIAIADVIRTNNVKGLKTLLKAGADIRENKATGEAPVALAAQEGHYENNLMLA